MKRFYGVIIIGILFWVAVVTVAFSQEATFEEFTTASCASTTTAALAANPGRISALLTNDSIQVIWIKVGEAAVANEGIRLNANGGNYYITNAEGNLDREAVNCIVASGTGTILAAEWSN